MSGRVRPSSESWSGPCKVWNEAIGEAAEFRRHPVADFKIAVAMRHHAKTFGGVDQHDIVRHMRPRLSRCGADDLRGGEDDALAAGAFVVHIGGAAGGAKTATEILRGAAGCAGLIDDRLRARGPVIDA